MKKIVTAIALTIALPAVAHAQAAPEKADCCAKMKEKMDCCKDMSGKAGMSHDMKAGMNMPEGHDMSKPAAKTPPANPHQNHQQ